MNKVSVYILTLNEANKIADAIRSVSWADEVIVADSGSTDATIDIAKELGAKIVQVPFITGFGQMRSDAIGACANEWVFSLDADERCTPEAAEEIQRIVADPTSADAYNVPRRNFFMGRWIKHCGWYPDYRLPQLFRKSMVRFHDDTRTVHEGFECLGNIGYMHNDIWQIPFINLEELIHKMQRYSSLGAEKSSEKGLKAGMPGALLHAIWAFVRIYVLKLGILDGWPGFVIALGNFEGTFYRYAKLATAEMDWKHPPERLP